MAKQRRTNRFLWVLIFLIVLMLLTYYMGGDQMLKRIRYPIEYKNYINKYALEYSVDPHLVASVIWVESRFRPEVISPKDARGLMQILPSTGEWAAEKVGISNFEEEQLFEPGINIRIGCWYLGFLTSQFPESRELVLASYNGGIGNVFKWLDNKEYSSDGQQLDHIPFTETRKYVEKVLKMYKIYKEIYPSF